MSCFVSWWYRYWNISLIIAFFMLLLATWQLSFCIVPLFCLMAAPGWNFLARVNENLESRRWQKCHEAVRSEGRRGEWEGQREEGNSELCHLLLRNSSCAYHCTRRKCDSSLLHENVGSGYLIMNNMQWVWLGKKGLGTKWVTVWRSWSWAVSCG